MVNIEVHKWQKELVIPSVIFNHHRHTLQEKTQIKRGKEGQEFQPQRRNNSIALVFPQFTDKDQQN